MAKVLGLDLGTNSLGWALVDESENEYTLIDKGVDIFQEGVARDKNNEKPAVQDRTNCSKYSSVTTIARRCPRSC